MSDKLTEILQELDEKVRVVKQDEDQSGLRYIPAIRLFAFIHDLRIAGKPFWVHKGYASWKEWVESGEMTSLKIGAVDNRVRLYKRWGKLLDEELDNGREVPTYYKMKRIDHIHFKLKGDEDAQREWMRKAILLRDKDLKNMIHSELGERFDTDKCDHSKVLVITRCKRCGQVFDIKEEDNTPD